MPDKEHMKSLMREAEIYKKHGLLEESKEKYEELLEFIQSHEKYSKDTRLLDAVQGKIRTLEGTLDEIERAPETPELTQEVQHLIGRLFSFSKNEDTAKMEGAIALAQFGQYGEAVREFQKLIGEGIMPLVAAKNVLMCHMTLSSADAAIDQFKQWVSQGTFAARELKYVRSYLSDNLMRRGIKGDLPQVDEAPSEEDTASEEEDILDISSFAVHFTHGPSKGQRDEFEVNFQSGNKVSTIIAAKQKDLVDSLEPGLQLADIECFSPVAVFNGMGTVSGMKKISSGPRRGDYSVDFTIKGE
jgi:tetratricopeptide (TPR) repeat protein